MAHKARVYHGENVDVSYDLKRCIHAEECGRRLSAVFDRDRVPWVQPDNAPAGATADMIPRCPSGALHYERKDGGEAEAIPAQNTIKLIENGPLYVRGDITIVQPDQTLVLKDTRAALCRCGASRNKPFCDNTHKVIGFRAPGARVVTEPVTVISEGGQLTIEPGANKSYSVSGNFTIVCADNNPVFSGTEQWLCRCGGSADKPFCDGTHKVNGFQSE